MRVFFFFFLLLLQKKFFFNSRNELDGRDASRFGAMHSAVWLSVPGRLGEGGRAEGAEPRPRRAGRGAPSPGSRLPPRGRQTRVCPHMISGPRGARAGGRDTSRNAGAPSCRLSQRRRNESRPLSPPGLPCADVSCGFLPRLSLTHSVERRARFMFWRKREKKIKNKSERAREGGGREGGRWIQQHFYSTSLCRSPRLGKARRLFCWVCLFVYLGKNKN